MAAYRAFDIERPPSLGQVPRLACERPCRLAPFATRGTLRMLVAGALLGGCSGSDSPSAPSASPMRTALFEGPGRQSVRAVAPAPNGGLYIAGLFEETVDVDPTAAVDARVSFGASDVFVVRLDGEGRVVWSHTFGGARQDEVASVAAVADGIVLTGHFGDTVDFDPGPEMDVRSKVGPYSEAYVLKLGHDGAHRFTKIFAGTIEPDNSYGAKVALAKDETLLVSGRFRGKIDFDPGPLRNAVEARGGYDGFVVRLGTDGSFLSVQQIGGAGDEASWAVPSPDGAIWIAGTFTTDVDLDPGPDVERRDAEGSQSGYIGRLDLSGRYVNGGALTASYVAIHDVAPTIDGGLWIAGAFAGEADLDPNDLVAPATANGEDGFALALAPDGSRRGLAHFDGPGAGAVRAVVARQLDAFVAGSDAPQVAHLSATGARTWPFTLMPFAPLAATLNGDELVVAGTVAGARKSDDGFVVWYAPLPLRP